MLKNNLIKKFISEYVCGWKLDEGVHCKGVIRHTILGLFKMYKREENFFLLKFKIFLDCQEKRSKKKKKKCFI